MHCLRLRQSHAIALLQTVHSPVRECFMESEHHSGVQGSGTALTSQQARLSCRISAWEITVVQCSTPLLLFVQRLLQGKLQGSTAYEPVSCRARSAQCFFCFLHSPVGRLRTAPLYTHTGQRPLHATAVWCGLRVSGSPALDENPQPVHKVWTHCAQRQRCWRRCR